MAVFRAILREVRGNVHKGFRLAVAVALPMVAAAVGPQSVKRAGQHVSFDRQKEGPYTPPLLQREWKEAQWTMPFDRCAIVTDADARQAQALRVRYPKGAYGSKDSGAQFVVKLKPATEYWAGYRVKFEEGFDFRKGGKLPGLASGGTAYTGGRIPKTGEGWSARFMWTAGGGAIAYLYHADMPGPWGHGLPLNVSFVPGRWHTIIQHIVLNEGSASNGVLEVWFDTKKVFDHRALRWRLGEKGPVDSFLFSTFYGGNTPEWAPASDQFARFDDFVLDDDSASLFDVGLFTGR